MTLAPGLPIEPPTTPGIVEVRKVSDDVVVLVEGFPARLVVAAPDLYLREVIDLDDEGVVEFVRAFGSLRVPPLTWLALRFVPQFSCGSVDELHRWEAAAAPHRPDGEYGYAVALDELRSSARLLRAMARHTVAALDGASVAGSWSAIDPAPTEERSWAMYAVAMNALLEVFAPAIAVPGLQPQFAVLTRRDIALANVLALQMHNTVARELTVRVCEKCGRRFTQQTGRAEHGQYRTNTESVRYCTAACARAEAARRYRERRRTERTGT